MMVDVNDDSLWIKKDINPEWAVLERGSFHGSGNPIHRIDSPDGSSSFVSRLMWATPVYYRNAILINGLPVKETQFSSRSGSASGKYDERTNSWIGTCRRENGVLFDWTYNIKSGILKFEKSIASQNPFPNGLSTPHTGGQSEWDGISG